MPSSKALSTTISRDIFNSSEPEPYAFSDSGLTGWLDFSDMLPDQTATFKDGDHPLFLYQLKPQNGAQSSKFTLPYTGYILSVHPKHILVIQNGGGSAILCTLASGGYWSQRIRAKNFPIAIAVLIAVLTCNFFIFTPIMHSAIQLSRFFRYILALLLLIPPGFLMGLPFPLGMRYMLNCPAQRAYAWTINGCASVLASIASAQIALSLGISAIMIFAISAYFLAVITLCFKRN